MELTKTIPIVMGKGARQTTVYGPCFTIVGWTDRVPEMGERTVPAPKPHAATAQVVQMAAAVPTTPPPARNDDLNDEIPF